jgi:hypothetical protein
MKRTTIYEVALTGSGQNFFTLYRHSWSNDHKTPPVCCFIQNLSVDFDEAVEKARNIAGPDQESENYSKKLMFDADEVNEIKRLGCSKEAAELDGVFTFGKHKHEKIEDVFVSDRKYVEWIAKGGFMKMTDRRTGRQDDFWTETIELDRPLRQQAIALFIGDGSWIEREGKFMPVERAEKLDWFASLKPNPEIVEGSKRIKGMSVHILKVYYNDSEWGGKHSFKFLDENGYIYHGSCTNRAINMKHEDVWVVMDFSTAIYNGKVYAKRITVKSEPSDAVEDFYKVCNTMDLKKEKSPEKWTKADQKFLDRLNQLQDIREGKINQTAGSLI